MSTHSIISLPPSLELKPKTSSVWRRIKRKDKTPDLPGISNAAQNRFTPDTNILNRGENQSVSFEGGSDKKCRQKNMKTPSEAGEKFSSFKCQISENGAQSNKSEHGSNGCTFKVNHDGSQSNLSAAQENKFNIPESEISNSIKVSSLSKPKSKSIISKLNKSEINLSKPNLVEPKKSSSNTSYPNIFIPNLFQQNLPNLNLSEPNISNPTTSKSSTLNSHILHLNNFSSVSTESIFKSKDAHPSIYEPLIIKTSFNEIPNVSNNSSVAERFQV